MWLPFAHVVGHPYLPNSQTPSTGGEGGGEGGEEEEKKEEEEKEEEEKEDDDEDLDIKLHSPLLSSGLPLPGTYAP